MDHYERAVSLATAGKPVFKAKHAAVLTYKGKILATGRNQYKTHPMMGRFNKHPEAVNLHAEIDCITRAIRLYGTSILKHSELYVARVLASGELGNSKPCLGCQKAIEAFSIPVVYWTTKEGWETLPSKEKETKL